MKRRLFLPQREIRWGVRFLLLAIVSLCFASGGFTALLDGFQVQTALESFGTGRSPDAVQLISNGRPRLDPLPPAQEVWNCEVVVVGGSLGGVAAAFHAMQSGAITCLIELTPWLGGQISSQGVSALDESHTMIAEQRFSRSWSDFKQLIQSQKVQLPAWANLSPETQVAELNSCWVGRLCFPPEAGANAAEALLQSAKAKASGSRWGTAIAFKGAEFDATGQEITAIYAVRRVHHPSTQPEVVQSKGRLSQEIASWYSWSANAEFEKFPLRLEAPPGKRLIVIDATDTGELVGWAGIPHRLGSEAKTTSGEAHAAERDNPDCTQAFTFPFVLALHDDRGKSLATLAQFEPEFPLHEHLQAYSLNGTPMFAGRSLFNYRRIVSTTRNDPFGSMPDIGDMTAINWTQGNDWNLMTHPLILNSKNVKAAGQQHNWLGGLSVIALKHAEEHALLFARWLLQQANLEEADLPLTYLSGADTPMGTASGLSMTPYIREGRRIMGRQAYGQPAFMLREADLRLDLPGGRDFSETAIALAHYDVDMHGCRYRNWQPSGEATSAHASELEIRPLQIPLESIIPQGVSNLLIGGKSLAVSHIVNAVTRTHYSEWGIGAAAGATSGWLMTKAPEEMSAADIIPKKLMPNLQQYLIDQGLQLSW